ncbi:long-chain-fatty-acid--CoA ligase [Thalassorhabdus alkalitolerans]|uniref:Long-chain-fatty-acid--CoA ligase n=1 Tax=Thalassorhabdus alkalitolerans TaxID=2282697 RepID=A0ABW0YIR5_9BACI
MKEWLKYWPKRLPSSLSVPKTTIVDNLEVSAKRYPDKVAVYYYGSAFTYETIFKEVNRLAAFLQKEWHMKKGDRVILYMQNSPSFLISYYGILQAGGVVVPVNPMNKEQEVAFYIEDSEAEIAIAGQELLGNIQGHLGQTTLKNILAASYGDFVSSPKYRKDLPDEAMLPSGDSQSNEGIHTWEDMRESKYELSPVFVNSEDLACLPYTSGTTGRPKGCMHTHYSIQANLAAAKDWMSMTPNSVSLASLPWFHVTGMQHSMNAPLFAGGAIVIMTRWNRETAVRLIEDYGCTNWINISTMVVDFLSHPEIEKKNLSSLQVIGGGGAPLPEAVGKKLQLLTEITYCEGYGLSETMSQTHFNPPDRPKLQCLGIPSFDVDVIMLDPSAGEEIPLGQQGEIAVSGPQVFKGYWRRPEETAESFIQKDGTAYFRTGDIGYMDPEGYFFMVDRKKRMINTAGFKVWPSEIESVLYQHEAVQQACVVGAPDPRTGEVVKAYVVLQKGYEPSEELAQNVIDWSRNQMAVYKTPKEIHFLEELPKTASGKILWRTLQDREWNRAREEEKA